MFEEHVTINLRVIGSCPELGEKIAVWFYGEGMAPLSASHSRAGLVAWSGHSRHEQTHILIKKLFSVMGN